MVVLCFEVQADFALLWLGPHLSFEMFLHMANLCSSGQIMLIFLVGDQSISKYFGDREEL